MAPQPPLDEEPVTDPRPLLETWDAQVTRRIPALDLALTWFVLDDVDIRWGPLSFSQLSEQVQRGYIYKRTRVWQDGMAAWRPAGDVEQLLQLWSRYPVPELLSEEPLTQLAMTPSSLELLRRTGDEHTVVVPLLTPSPPPEVVLPRWPLRVERALQREQVTRVEARPRTWLSVASAFLRGLLGR